jgi:hypothetical protein
VDHLVGYAGHPDPDDTARMLMMIRDGIVIGGDLDGADTLNPHVRNAITRILTAPDT